MEVFSEEKFPSYCSGSAFVLNSKVSKVSTNILSDIFIGCLQIFFNFQTLLTEFRKDPTYLWIDDVFITGILAKKAKVKLFPYTTTYALLIGWLKNAKLRKGLIFAHVPGRENHPFR